MRGDRIRLVVLLSSVNCVIFVSGIITMSFGGTTNEMSISVMSDFKWLNCCEHAEARVR